ncbi:hypothetical protein EIP86_008391 [Pleurotus ostreatoroseus]|nr:hypothetical protein EIP86_008391 [Pleurotus ostreatoroseus]
MDPEAPARRPDGTLKDASEMTWDFSPSQSDVTFGLPLSEPPLPTPPAPKKKTLPPKRKHDGLSSGEPQAKKAPVKATAVQCRLKDDISDGEHEEPTFSQDASDTGLFNSKKKRAKRGEALRDVLTVFKSVGKDEDDRETYDGMDHYEVYRRECVPNNIVMDRRAIPPEEAERVEAQLQDPSHISSESSAGISRQSSIVDFAESADKWSRQGLWDKIIQFIIETDQSLDVVEEGSFWEMMTYNHPSMTTKDTFKPTKCAEMVYEHAKMIRDELDAELVVEHLTADNVGVNDKGVHKFGTRLKLARVNAEFRASEQRLNCFDHAVHLAEAAFLTALSPKKKGRGGKDVPILEVPADPVDGDYDPEDKDTEEDIQALETEINQMIAELPPDSDKAKLLAGLLVKVRGFITKVRRSPQAKAFFRKCCKQADVEVLELLPYCKTRWGSWHDVLGRLLRLRKAVTAFINQADNSDEVPNVEAGKRKYSSFRFETVEWDMIKNIYLILNEAVLVQQHFSAEQTLTVYRILPVYKRFRDNWTALRARDDMHILAPALDAGIANIEKYYNKTEKQPANIVCLYLNPAVKDEYFEFRWSEEGKAEAKKTIEKIFDRYRKHICTEPSAAAPTSHYAPRQPASERSNYDDSWIEAATARRRQREQTTWSSDPRAELTRSQNNACTYPIMAEIARDYLLAQGSSVPCERAFSSAGITDDKRCGRFLPVNFAQIQTAKARYKAERRRREESKRVQREMQRRRWEQDAVEQVRVEASTA